VPPNASSASTERLSFRRPTEDDHPRVLAVMEQWWGGLGGAEGARFRAALLPRLFFQHFTTTSTVVEQPDGRLVGFLVGFLTPAEPGTAYVHFVGVDRAARRAGLGSALYRRFLDDATRAGATTVRAVTSPTNTQSVAFHAALGFAVSPVRPDYDGPGNDRVCFTRSLPATGQELATLLRRLEPYRHDGAYVFATVDAALPPAVEPVVTVQEDEGLTVVVPKEQADELGMPYTYVAAWITLRVASALDAVGLTAAVSRALADASLSANVVAGVHHDHLFVPHNDAEAAVRVLTALTHRTR
jgi:GNAT superfamily N-acetyltransferase